MPSNSATNSDQEDTFATIVDGGKVYGDRIAAWVKAKTEHDAAYAKLQLGRATKNMLEEATAARDAAQKTLADARAKADEIVAGAMTKGQALLQHSIDRQKAAEAAAAEQERKNTENMAAASAKAYKIVDDANARYAVAEALAADNHKSAKELAAAKQAAERAHADAEAARNTFLRKHQEATDFHKRLWG